MGLRLFLRLCLNRLHEGRTLQERRMNQRLPAHATGSGIARTCSSQAGDDDRLRGGPAVGHPLNDCSAMHLWRLTHDERYQHLEFPKPIEINGRNYWRLRAILTWIDQRE